MVREEGIAVNQEEAAPKWLKEPTLLRRVSQVPCTVNLHVSFQLMDPISRGLHCPILIEDSINRGPETDLCMLPSWGTTKRDSL